MNNSIIKLEDFELDEISGGDMSKKVGEYTVKGISSFVLGVGAYFLSKFVSKIIFFDFSNNFTSCEKVLDNFLDEKLDIKDDFGRKLISHYILIDIPIAFAGVVGWKLGG